jgi:hypothetical protein
MANTEFWFEYITATREWYLMGSPADPNADPMLAAMCEWLKKIEIVMQKAAAEGCDYFSCRLVEKRRRIALRFARGDGRGFERTLSVDGRFRRRHGKPLTDMEILDLKICIQTLIINEPQRLSRLPLGPGGSIFRWRGGRRQWPAKVETAL